MTTSLLESRGLFSYFGRLVHLYLSLPIPIPIIWVLSQKHQPLDSPLPSCSIVYLVFLQCVGIYIFSFLFTLSSTGTTKFTSRQILFYVDYNWVWSFGYDYIFIWSNIDFWQNSVLITFPTLSGLVLCLFYANLLHSLIILFIILSLSLTFPMFCFLSIFALM